MDRSDNGDFAVGQNFVVYPGYIMNRPTSLYLDIIRPLAALAVLLFHASDQNLSGGQLHFMAPAGFQAVDIFFVLSGFVIAHVYATKERHLRVYLVSRAARIYSVAIPVLVLIAVLDAIGLRENPSIYQGPFQAFTPGLVIRSVFFLGEQWSAHRFPGSDGPYWSLGFEIWYYLAFAAFVFIPGPKRWLATAAVLVFIGPKVALMFPAWLMGVAAYHFCRKQHLSKGVGWLLFTLSLGLMVGFQLLPHSLLQQFTAVSLAPDRLASTLQDYSVAAIFCMNIVGFVVISDSFAPWLEPHAKMIRWIAGGTFSIYLAHLPIMHLLAAMSPWPKTSTGTLMLLLFVTPVACMAFAEISERRKDTWRQLIDHVLPGQSGEIRQARAASRLPNPARDLPS
jgi:peptidoglycan/LPS O-acetylase OafA/YrhL